MASRRNKSGDRRWRRFNFAITGGKAILNGYRIESKELILN